MTAGYTPVAKLLVDRGADINAVDINQTSSLMLASLKGQAPIAKMLLGKGADVNDKDKNGVTAMMFASDNGQRDAVKLLITHKTDVNAASNTGTTPLMFASTRGFTDIVQLLLQNKADVNAFTIKSIPVAVQGMSIGFPPGSSALHFARLRKNNVVEDLLLKAGAVQEPSMMKK